MGEKIRDIKSIKFGQTSFMVELNEGYSASQGRLIHIQNKKFRYLLTEKDFYHLSSMIMRAWSEFSYFKHKTHEYRKLSDFAQNDQKLAVTSDVLIKIADRLDQLNVEYRFIDICNNKISMIVQPDQLKEFETNIVGLGAIKINHPFGKEVGYKFLYQMNPFLMFEIGGVSVEVFCQLPCGSITPKTWIPLDRMIQKRVWSMHEVHSETGKWCDTLSIYIYLLCYAIFIDKGFSPHVRTMLVKYKYILDSNDTKELFYSVFFNYTETIINKLKQEEFDVIIPDYYNYTNY